MSQWPVEVVAMRRLFKKVTVKRWVMPRDGFLLNFFKPGQKIFHHFPVRFFVRVGDLLAGEAVDRKRFIFDMRSAPNPAFLIKTVLRVRKINRTHAYERVFFRADTRSFNIY